MIYVYPQLREVSKVERNPFKSHHRTQVDQSLRHTLVIDGQSTHHIYEVVVWRIEVQKCLVVVLVNSLAHNSDSANLILGVSNGRYFFYNKRIKRESDFPHFDCQTIDIYKGCLYVMYLLQVYICTKDLIRKGSIQWEWI